MFKINDKVRNNLRLYEYKNNLINKFSKLISWENIEGLAPYPEWIEERLIIDGAIGFTKVNNIPMFVRGEVGGQLDAWGLPTTFNYHTYGDLGKSGTFTNGKDGIIIFNNCTHTPDIFEINRYSDMLANNDLSIRLAVINSRNIPIPLCDMSAQKKEYEDAIEKMQQGKSTIIKSLSLEGKTLNITDAQAVERIECHNRLRNELIKNISNDFGVMVNTIDKKAQINSEELQQYDDLTALAYFSRYDERTRGANAINKLYGLDIKVTMPFWIDNNFIEENKEDIAAAAESEEGGGSDED